MWEVWSSFLACSKRSMTLCLYGLWLCWFRMAENVAKFKAALVRNDLKRTLWLPGLDVSQQGGDNTEKQEEHGITWHTEVVSTRRAEVAKEGRAYRGELRHTRKWKATYQELKQAWETQDTGETYRETELSGEQQRIPMSQAWNKIDAFTAGLESDVGLVDNMTGWKLPSLWDYEEVSPNENRKQNLNSKERQRGGTSEIYSRCRNTPELCNA